MWQFILCTVFVIVMFVNSCVCIIGSGYLCCYLELIYSTFGAQGLIQDVVRGVLYSMHAQNFRSWPSCYLGAMESHAVCF